MIKANRAMVYDPSISAPLFEKYDYLESLFRTFIEKNGIEVSDPDVSLRYIAWVYDPYSPYVSRFPDIRKRKEHVARQLKTIPALISPKLVTFFLKELIRNSDWMLIASNENAFEEFAEKVNEPISQLDDEEKVIKAVERKAKLLEYMERINETIKTLKKVFFYDDEDLIAEENVVKTLSPETIAKLVGKK